MVSNRESHHSCCPVRQRIASKATPAPRAQYMHRCGQMCKCLPARNVKVQSSTRAQMTHAGPTDMTPTCRGKGDA
eukprot:9423902-Alexandrium_andersonii.AAC.1